MRARSIFTESRISTRAGSRRLHVDEVDDDEATDVAGCVLRAIRGPRLVLVAVVSINEPRVARAELMPMDTSASV
jgi:hypothetical protein